MTFQTSEKFLYQGQQLFSHDHPLDQHPDTPEFLPVTSMCWRGYNGSWRIQKNQLFLVKLEAHIKHPTALRERRVINLKGGDDELCFDIVLEPMAMEANLKVIFPQTVGGKLFADWFTGEINFGQGEGVDRGMVCAYQSYLTLGFEKGVLVNEKTRNDEEVFPLIPTHKLIEVKKSSPRTKRGLYRCISSKNKQDF